MVSYDDERQYQAIPIAGFHLALRGRQALISLTARPWADLETMMTSMLSGGVASRRIRGGSY